MPEWLIPLLLSVGGTEIFKLFADSGLTGKEKELLQLQQKGQREGFERDLAATKALQTEDATAKWQQMLTQMGMAQAESKHTTADKVAGIRAQAGMAAAQGNAPLAADPSMQHLATLMESPASFRNILGLE